MKRLKLGVTLLTAALAACSGIAADDATLDPSVGGDGAPSGMGDKQYLGSYRLDVGPDGGPRVTVVDTRTAQEIPAGSSTVHVFIVSTTSELCEDDATKWCLKMKAKNKFTDYDVRGLIVTATSLPTGVTVDQPAPLPSYLVGTSAVRDKGIWLYGNLEQYLGTPHWVDRQWRFSFASGTPYQPTVLFDVWADKVAYDRPVETACTDGTDDDGESDGVDCLDADCSEDPACPIELNCTNAADDDLDGDEDCEDVDCATDPACFETNCGDAIDNDFDDDTDCEDSDCDDTLGCITGLGTALFGHSVAMSGDTIAIGSPNRNSDTGAVWIFVRDGANWRMQGDPLAVTVTPYPAKFGYSVALDGDRLAVGCGESQLATQARVYIYERDVAGEWTLTETIDGPTSSASPGWGYGIALDDDKLAVSKPDDGEVYVYHHDGTDWDPTPIVLDHMTVNGTNPYVGPVDLDGDTLVVGDPKWNNPAHVGPPGSPTNNVSGRAVVYEWSGTAWSPPIYLTPPSHNGAWAGSSVAIAGDRILVGARGHSFTNMAACGRVYEFSRTMGVWSATPVDEIDVADFPASSCAAYQQIGASIDMTVDSAVIGAPGQLNTVDGRSFLIQYDMSPDLSAYAHHLTNDRFGTSVAVDGETFVCGAPTAGGAAYVTDF